MPQLQAVNSDSARPTADWELLVQRQLFADQAADDPAVAVDMNFLKDCVQTNNIRDREWFYSIFHRVPRDMIRTAFLDKKLPVLQIVLGCSEYMARENRERNFRQEVSETNRIRSDFGQKRRGGRVY